MSLADPPAGANNLLFTVDSDEVDREGAKDYVSLNPTNVIFRVFAELAAGPDFDAWRTALPWDSSDAQRFWSFAYSHGAVGGRQAPGAGDWACVKGNDVGGVVIETSGGEIKRLATTNGKQLVIDEAGHAPADVTFVWSPGLDLRAHAEPEMAAFYGSPSSLFTLVFERASYSSLKTLHGKDVLAYQADGMAAVLTVDAPPLLQSRVYQAGSAADVAAAVDGFGKGLEPYTGRPLPVGTWCFDSDTLVIVLSTDPSGQPVHALYPDGGNITIVPFPNGIKQVWSPASRPRAYAPTAPAGYADLDALNGLLGWLRVAARWKVTVGESFNAKAIASTHWFKPDVASWLASGPGSASDWRGYFADRGGTKTGAAEPGDLVLTGSDLGIALDAGDVALIDGSEQITVRKLAASVDYWRPQPAA